MDEKLLGKCDMPQFIGVAPCDTIGLVIAGIDDELRDKMKIPKEYSAIGLIGSRTGAGGQITAVDDAVKGTNTKVISIELPRDTKGWGGHGNFIVIGARTVSDAEKAVSDSLELIKKNVGEVYISEAGHMEFQYSARAGEAINMAFDIPIGEPFGFVCASPAPIGLVIADIAVKSSNIKITKLLRPSDGTSHSNEVIITFTGETSAVRSAVQTAREAGMKMLRAMGSDAPPVTEPYI